MVIPGNLPSQLCVLDSSQQLYAPLFLVSSLSSANTFFSKLSEKTPPQKNSFVPLQASPTSLLLRISFSISAATTFSAPLPCYHLQRSFQSKTLCSSIMLSPPTISAAATFSAPHLLSPPFLAPPLLQPPFLLSIRTP